MTRGKEVFVEFLEKMREHDTDESKNRYIPHPYGECFECLMETFEMMLLCGCVLYILFLFLCRWQLRLRRHND